MSAIAPSPSPQKITPHKTLEGFTSAISREFIEGSAIAPALFEAAIRIHSDLEFDEITGEPIATPVHDYLGWNYVRFSPYGMKPTLYGALFNNEDGSIWQAIVSIPDEDKGKSHKYYRAGGSGATPYLPPVDAETRKCIGQRYGVEVPAEGSFWEWVAAHPELRIYLTEGGKKSLSLLSQGYIAIALLGVSAGYSVKDEVGDKVDPYIVPGLKPFLNNGVREFTLAFDRDSKPTARDRVNISISRFGKLLNDQGQRDCTVKVVTWKHSHGKGVDDLIVNRGVKAFEDAVRLAESLERWQWRNDYQERFKLSWRPAIQFNQKFITDSETRKPVFQIPESEKLIGIKSPKGSGKTEALVEIAQNSIAEGQRVIVIGHRVQLVQQLCDRLGVPYVTEIRSEGTFVGYGLCIDSLHPKSQARFDANGWSSATVIVDECEQVFWHTLNSSTCRKERVPILGQLRQLLTNVMNSPSGRIVLSDADLSDYSIRFVQGMASSEVKPWIVRNDYRPDQPWDVYSYGSRESWLDRMLESLFIGEKALVLASAQKAKSLYSTQNLEKLINQKFPELRVLRIDSKTVADKTHPAYGCTSNSAKFNRLLSEYDVVIASPTIETGISIDLKGHFNSVWAVMGGNLPENSVRQFLARLREPVARHIFAEKYGKTGMIDRGYTSVKELLKTQNKTIRATIHQLGDADLDALETVFDRTALITWGAMSTRVNAGQYQYRNSVLWSLEDEGHRIHDAESWAEPEELRETKDDLKAVRDANKLEQASGTAESTRLDETTYRKLEQQRQHTKEELQQMRRYQAEQKYCTDSPDADLLLKDDDGWFPKITLHYYLTVGNPYLKKRDRGKINSLTHDNKIWMPDANRSTYSAQVGALRLLGIDESFIDPERDYRGTDADVEDIAAMAIENQRNIKVILGITVSDKMSNIQIMKALLGKLGLDLRCDGRDGGRGQRWYRLRNLDDGRLEIFDRWLSRDTQSAVDPAPQTAETRMVDPAPLIRSITPPPGSVTCVDPTPKQTTNKPNNPQTVEEAIAGRRVKFGTSLSPWVIAAVEGAIATIELSNIYGTQQRQVPLNELEVVA